MKEERARDYMFDSDRFAGHTGINENYPIVFDQVRNKFEVKLVTCSHINILRVERIDAVGDPDTDAVV
jgi:hypothetical protein